MIRVAGEIIPIRHPLDYKTKKKNPKSYIEIELIPMKFSKLNCSREFVQC
jgi:hypothetical protein